MTIAGERVPNHEIFLSYSNKDKAVADAVCAALEAKHIRCWIAPRDIVAGAAWGNSIIQAIEDAQAMVLIYSDSANLSPQVAREVERTVAKGLLIIPFRIADSPMSREMEYFLSSSHWFDAMTGPMEEHLERFVPMVRSLLAAGSQARQEGPAARAAKAAIPAAGGLGRALRRPYVLVSVLAGVLILAAVSAVLLRERDGGQSNFQKLLTEAKKTADSLSANKGSLSAAQQSDAGVALKAVQAALVYKPTDREALALRDNLESLCMMTMDLGNGVTMKLVLIPAGKFMMGEGNDKHEVAISNPFYVGVTEVTQAQYEAVMGTNPSKFNGATNPVEEVSWNDATEFCKKLSEKTRQAVRLPTEAEWEYACRAGTATAFSFGDADSALGDYAWYKANSGSKTRPLGQTQPVGQKKPNAWGLYDMHGNVWERCADWRGDYPNGAVTDPQGPASGTYRVLRSGSWSSNPDFCCSASRSSLPPDYRNGNVGFRVVMSVSAPKL